MARETSYGIVPLRKHGNEWQVLLIQHGSARYWGFPKGHAEADESPNEAAERELKEETNLEIHRLFSESPIQEHYHFQFKGTHIDKTVWYFVAEVKGKVKLQHAEVSDSKWIPLSDAPQHITYDTDKAVLRQATAFLETQFLD